MNYLIEKYRKYKIEYDPQNKILTLNKPIAVDDFVKMKIDILKLKLNIKFIKDIRVNA